jgi:hypothetical protein
MSGAGLEEVDHALIRLARGDTSAVEALPLSAFLDPVARLEVGNDGLARRWTLALPAALDRLDAAARARALTRLDARYQTLAATYPATERARLATAFLPAPTAVADLQLATNRAFDLGRFSDFLGLTHLLSGPRATATDDRRTQVALLLSGQGPQVDASLHLPPPGTPLPSATNLQEPDRHLAVRWRVVPGWVLALDPFDQVVWQYRVDRLAQVTTGPGAVLVRDSSGLRALDDQGTLMALPPLPTGAAVLAVAGGAAWFATGERAWRLRLGDRVVQALTLDAPPLGAPLVRGAQSLWLTSRDLLLFDGDRLLHRFQHRLPAGTGWRLGVDGDRPLILGTEQRTWRLESFADQLLRLDGTAKAELLLQARRIDEALAALGEPRDDHARRVALRAHLAKGARHVAELGERADGWCTDAQDRALVLLARLWSVDPGGNWRTPSAAASVQELLGKLDALAREAPAVWLTTSVDALADDPTTWDHACSGTAWLLWRGQSVVPAASDLAHLVADSPITAAKSPICERRADGSLVMGDAIIRLERGIDAISVSCQHATGVALWRQRWRPADFLAAPSQTIDVRDGVVLVVEGGLRLNAFALAHGMRRAQYAVDDLSSGMPYLIGDHLAILGPLGVDIQLTVIDPQLRAQRIQLAAPARWVTPLANELLVLTTDGMARLQPSGRQVTLPADLARSRQAPQASAEGLVLGDRLWPWSR